MWVYSTKDECLHGGLVYQEVDGIHNEEFINKKSTFVYYIIQGKGKFVIEGKEYPVKASDNIIIPTGTKFYYFGKMKQILITVPAWEEDSEEVVRVLAQKGK